MLNLYNSLTRKKEQFKPIHEGKVGMYVCGPTVYDHCHLGHARGYVAMDVLRRYLEYSGYEVRFIMNYTDVGHIVHDAETGEDKIEQRAKKEKVDPLEIAEKYIESCKEDFEALNIKKANFYPRPTQYIAQIIKFVETLIEKGYAYVANGSVYFSVDKFPDYGKLSGKKKDDLIAGARVEVNPEKKNPLDFALWIKATPEHILHWDSPWSVGYPGWHIECSVMSCDLLGGDTFDIHGGGNENAFPHNENEIAQSEAYLGQPMANFWTLWNMVNVSGEKASKSKGNAVSIKDALKKYDPAVLRLWILSSHYRSIMNFTENALEQAKINLERLAAFLENILQVVAQPVVNSIGTESLRRDSVPTTEYLERFVEAMDDDLNTPVALSVVYDLITETNKLLAKNELSPAEAKKILSSWKKMNKVFGLEIASLAIEIPEEIQKLAEERKLARENKDFKKSDELRDRLSQLGYTIEDLKDNKYSIKKK